MLGFWIFCSAIAICETALRIYDKPSLFPQSGTEQPRAADAQSFKPLTKAPKQRMTAAEQVSAAQTSSPVKRLVHAFSSRMH
jgi:hypothetical protein